MTIHELDIVTLPHAIDGWPAGTAGTLVILDEPIDVALVEVGTDGDIVGLSAEVLARGQAAAA